MFLLNRTVLLMLMITSSLAAFCSADSYDKLRNFNSQVAKMTIIDGDNTETIYFDEDGMKIFAELSYKNFRGTHYEEVAAFDNSGVRVIYTQVNGNIDDVQRIIYDADKHKDYMMPQPVALSGDFKNVDSEGNWTLYDELAGTKISRELIYYADPEAPKLIEWAKRQRQLMFEQNNIHSDEITTEQIAFVGGAAIIGLLFGILFLITIVFGIMCLVAYNRVRNFFNNKAGEKILSKKLRLYKHDAVVAIIGGIYGFKLWGGALFGDSLSIIFNALLLAVIIGGIIYFRKLYRRLLKVAEPKACKWYLLYTALTMICCFTVGAILCVVAITIMVGSLMGKGMIKVWDDEVSHQLPSTDGSSRSRQCSTCSNYNNGYCSYHNRPMPKDGGCGSSW